MIIRMKFLPAGEVLKTTVYDERYEGDSLYWPHRPSSMLCRALELLPTVDRGLKALDIGCGEGASAIFLARNGFEVTAFDLSPYAIQKTTKFADRLGLKINAFVADINEFEPDEDYDLIFSSGTIQYITAEKRKTFVDKLKASTKESGLNVIHTFVDKPFITLAPDAEANEHLWKSGELLGLYSDWQTEHFLEEIKSCNSSGVPHHHAHNRIWTRKAKLK